MNTVFRFLFAFLFLFNSVALAAPDYNKPALASTKTNFPLEIRDNVVDVAKMDFTTATNIPTNAIRYTRTTKMLEQYNGATWDEVAIGAVGTIISQFSSTAPSGYLILAGGTIGDASSGASLRANADTVYLFTQLWNNLTNTEAPVSSGRGANAAADYAAHKTITLPDMRQKFPIMKAASGTGSTLGGTGGIINHDHTIAHTHNMASHTHTIAHTHNMGNHTHSTPNHTHNQGNLVAFIGFTNADAQAIFASVNGSITFTSSNRAHLWYDNNNTFDGNQHPGWPGVSTAGIASTTVSGTVGSDGASTTGGPSTNTSDGTNTASSGGPSTNVTDGTNTANSGTNNPPFIAMNFFIKY